MKIVSPNLNNITHAVKILLDGGIVGIPTETVYGIACNAFDAHAAHEVFKAKKRPLDNPLIVHIGSLDQLGLVALSWPDYVEELVHRFWPGPLTLVLPKTPEIPYEVTGGLETVAVRMPKHPVALKLIQEADVPFAAPSANPFMRLSPTQVEHFDPELSSHLRFVLDGGPCEVGLESTVLDCTLTPPRILRPGAISRAEIQAAIQQPLSMMAAETSKKSPGNYNKHYAPKSKLILAGKLTPDQPGLVFDEPANEFQIKMPLAPAAYASKLYAAMYKLDQMGFEEFYVQLPPHHEDWEAIYDRLKKASSIEVF